MELELVESWPIGERLQEMQVGERFHYMSGVQQVMQELGALCPTCRHDRSGKFGAMVPPCRCVVIIDPQ